MMPTQLRMTATVLLVLSLLTVLTACSGGGKKSGSTATAAEQRAEDLSRFLEWAADNAIIQAVDEFARQTSAYQAQATQFCQQPNDTALNSLQAAWRDTFEQWYQLSLYNFGPLDDDIVFSRFMFIDSLRLRGTDYRLTNRSAINRNLAADTTLDSAFFAAQNFQELGLLPLELLSFETSASEHSQDATLIVQEYLQQPRKCDLLQGLAARLHADATYVQIGWKTAFKDSGSSYRELFLTNQLPDGSEPEAILLVNVQRFLDYLDARNVVSVAAKTSGHAWSGIGAAMTQLDHFLDGTPAPTKSLLDLMNDAGSNVASEAVASALEEAKLSVVSQDAAMLAIALGKLDGYFKREIPTALSIELGFNFTDGD